jgi:DNA-directed RNA polymerase specialized sigma subunit
MRGLNKLYYLKLDIENIKEEIRNIPTISSPQITGMPHGTDVSNPIEAYFLKKEKLIEKLNSKIEKYTEELIRIEDIIDTIDDEEVRAIARMRFVQCLKWEEIGERVHLDRTNCARKLKKYIKNMDI